MTSIETSFNYIIVGAGTAGLVLASRLTENPAISVAVLEAGNDITSTPEVTIPGQSLAVLSLS